MAEEEIPLAGGMGSGGAVVRVGDTVRRPWRAHSPAVHALLAHLAAQGFDGAPRFLGADDRGREILTYLDGEVGLPPFASWTAADDLLVSVADLQRRMHAAARSFVPPADAHWDRANLPGAGPGDIVCHNDLCVENVVVRGGGAVGFIDFDFAAPNDPLVDIAIAARHWIPFRAPQDLDPGRAGVDQVARFRLLGDAHGLTADQRARVVSAGLDFLDRALVSMRLRAERGEPAYVTVWEQGYPAQNRRSFDWLTAHAAHLTT